jgi:hypothetical protein
VADVVLGIASSIRHAGAAHGENHAEYRSTHEARRLKCSFKYTN